MESVRKKTAERREVESDAVSLASELEMAPAGDGAEAQLAAIIAERDQLQDDLQKLTTDAAARAGQLQGTIRLQLAELQTLKTERAVALENIKVQIDILARVNLPISHCRTHTRSLKHAVLHTPRYSGRLRSFGPAPQRRGRRARSSACSSQRCSAWKAPRGPSCWQLHMEGPSVPHQQSMQRRQTHGSGPTSRTACASFIGHGTSLLHSRLRPQRRSGG
jgi:hypothetical protein